MIKFEANYEVRPIVIKCDNNYTEKYTREVLRNRLSNVFRHKNFQVWIDRAQKDGNKKYTFEVIKSGFDQVNPIDTKALNPDLKSTFKTFAEVRKFQKEFHRKDHDEFERYLDKYEDSTSEEKVDILWNALDFMQSYNDRSVNDCIVIAMGGTIDTINNHDLKVG